MSILCTEQKEKYFNFLNDKFSCIYPSDCYDRTDHPEGWSDSDDYWWEEEDYWENIAVRVGASGVNFGASKVVFWFLEIPDYVVKIPIMGAYDDTIEDFKDYDHAYLANIPSHHSAYDYCGLEADISNIVIAKYNTIKQFFALTEYIGTTKNGIHLYLSEKIDESLAESNEADNINISPLSKQEARLIEDSYGYDIGGLGRWVIETLLEQYGTDLVYQLIDFIYNYGIADLHDGNLGFNRYNKLVLMDFSGFEY